MILVCFSINVFDIRLKATSDVPAKKRTLIRVHNDIRKLYRFLNTTNLRREIKKKKSQKINCIQGINKK